MTVVTRRFLGVLAGLALVALAACNIQNMGLDKDKDAAARAMFDNFRKGDLSQTPLGPEMQTPEAQAAIPQLMAIAPKGEPTAVKVLGWNVNFDMSAGRTEKLQTSHEWTFPDRVLIVETVMSRSAPQGGQMGPWRLHGLAFRPKPAEGAPEAPAKAPTPT